MGCSKMAASYNTLRFRSDNKAGGEAESPSRGRAAILAVIAIADNDFMRIQCWLPACSERLGRLS
jgi:hypothetical protein